MGFEEGNGPEDNKKPCGGRELAGGVPEIIEGEGGERGPKILMDFKAPGKQKESCAEAS
jgi:hypothetical protein